MLAETDPYDSDEAAPTWKQQHLNAAVLRFMAQRWQVYSIEGDFATLIRRSRNGWFNFITAMVTGGLWLIYLAFRSKNPAMEKVVLRVDDYGNVSVFHHSFSL